MGAANTWVYRLSDGQICKGRGPDPTGQTVRNADGSVSLVNPSVYGLLVLPDTDPWPDERTTHAASATSVRDATAAEIAAFAATQEKLVPVQDLIGALTDAELNWFHTSTDATVRKWWLMLLTSKNGLANVHSQKFKDGWAYIRQASVTAGVWLDPAAANARMVALTGG